MTELQFIGGNRARVHQDYLLLSLIRTHLVQINTHTRRTNRDQIWSNTPHPGSMNLQTNKQEEQTILKHTLTNNNYLQQTEFTSY